MPEPRRKRETSEPQNEIARGEDPLIPALLTGVVAEICAAMSASGAVIAGLDAQGVFCLASTGDAPAVGSRIQPNSGLTLECLKTGKVVLREDAGSDSGTPPSMDGSLTVRSAVAVPILAEGSVVGTIEVFTSRPSAIDPSAIALLEGMTDFLAPILAPGAVYATPPAPADSTFGAIQAETPSFAEEETGIQGTVASGNAEDLVDSPSPSIQQGPASCDATPSGDPQLVAETATEGELLADAATEIGQQPVGQAMAAPEGLADGATDVAEQVVERAPTARARVTDSAADMLHRLAESTTARVWVASATISLVLLFLFVGLRPLMIKTSSAIPVPLASGWETRDDSARPAENEARYTTEVQSDKNSEASLRPEAALSTAPPSPSNAGQEKGGATAPPGSRASLVERMKAVFSSRPADGSASRLQDSKPVVPAGREQIVNAPSAAPVVEGAALEPPEVAMEPETDPALGATPSFLSPIEPAMISRPDFVLDHTLKGHSGWVTGVAFSSDGRQLASGSWDRTVKFWDVPTGQELNTVGSKMKEVQALAFSRDGHWLAVENSSNTVTLWDATAETEVRTLPSNKPLGPLGTNWVYSIAFSPDGRWLASGVDDKTVRIWEVRTGRAVRDLTGLRRSVIYVAFSPDSRWLASGDDDKSIRIWEVSSGKEMRRLTGHKRAIYAVAFSPNGRWLASASADKTIKLWDIEAGREVHTLTGHGNQVTSVSFSPDGRWLASGSRDKTIKIWDVETGHAVQTLGAHDHPIYTVAFDSRGRWLASGSEDGTINLWRLVGAVERSKSR